MDKSEEALARVRDEEVRKEALEEAKDSDFTKQLAWFTIDVVEPSTGKRFSGKFLSKIPALDAREEIGLTVAHRSGGLPYNALPEGTRYRLEMMATFPVMLSKRPDWFKSPGAFLDAAVPAAVYAKLLEHLDVFFRPRPDTGGSGQEHADGAGPAPAVAG